MKIEKYTQRSQGFLQSAQTYATNESHQQLLPDHLLKVLLDDPDGMAISLLKTAGANVIRFKNDLQTRFSKLPKVTGSGQQKY